MSDEWDRARKEMAAAIEGVLKSDVRLVRQLSDHELTAYHLVLISFVDELQNEWSNRRMLEANQGRE